MPFAKHAIHAICRFSAQNKNIYKLLYDLSADQVARRLAIFAGIKIADILATGDRFEFLVSIIVDRVVHDTTTQLQGSRLKYQKTYAALWAYRIPEEQTLVS